MFETAEVRANCAILKKLSNVDIVYGGVICRGVLRSSYVEISGVGAQALLLDVPQARFSEVSQNEEIMISGIVYTVDDFAPDRDRTGIMTLVLNKAQ